jgi:hypothetical protein
VKSPLIRRLQREAKANPAKAGALALVLLVAMGFWAPLVIRWCSPAADASATPIAAAEQKVPSNAGAVSRSVSADAATVPSVPWQRLMQAIEQDPRMQPTRRLSQLRDPFGPSAAELAAEKASQQKKTKRAPPPELLPADAGLVLNSTLVGSGRRMALIGGEPYWEGDTVHAPHGSESFRLIEIFARQVVLEHQGKHYGLEIKSTSHDAPLAGEPDKPLSDSSPHNSRPRNSTPRGGKAGAGKQATPFANVNAND